MPKTRNVVRGAIQIVVTLTTGSVITSLIDNNTPEPDGKLDKLGQKTGGYVLGAMISEAAANFVDEKYDAVMNASNKVTVEVNKN